MYLDYFGFQHEPFNITPDSRFLFLSERHREALAALHYGIEQRKGFIALTGEIGCGKTTICRALLGRLDREQVRVALILNPELDDLELLQAINSEFGITANSTSKRELLQELNRFLLGEYEQDRNVVLLIDEAQRLSPAALEQVRLLSNLETETTKLIQIALVGQPELADILDLPELEQLNQRITVRFHIQPLSYEELQEYVAHRLSVAEPSREVPFDPKALRRIFEYSGGVPRRVNVVCDRALLVAYTREKDGVDEECAQRAISEVDGPSRGRKRAATPAPPPVRGQSSGTDWRKSPPLEPMRPLPAASRLPSWALGLLVLAGLIAVAYGISEWVERDARPTAVEVADATPPAEPETAHEPEQEETTPPAQARRQAIAEGALSGVIAEGTRQAREEPTPTPTPEPTPTPQPTPEPTPQPEPEDQNFELLTGFDSPPIAEPDPTPAPEPTPQEPAPDPVEVAVAEETPEPTPAPEPTPSEPPADHWRYDSNGILRAPGPRYAYPAAVLTWLSHSHGQRLSDSELEMLGRMTPGEIAEMGLAEGRPPLHLREARLPPSLGHLPDGLLPALIQVDSSAPGFGPWTVLDSHDGVNARLLDPRSGRLNVPLDMVEEHLAAVVALFFDADGLVGLEPRAEGEAVLALQEHLRERGLYRAEPSGVFDPLTEAAVKRFRQEAGLSAATSEVDALTVLHLLVPTTERES